MKFEIEHRKFDIPSIPQLGDYEHALRFTCDCQEDNVFHDRLSHWVVDGLYDSLSGLMICFTCKDCGKRFYFHVNDNLEIYAGFGCFDEFEIK